jgi:hypothetical protein
MTKEMKKTNPVLGLPYGLSAEPIQPNARRLFLTRNRKVDEIKW